ncbi:hypothetical protein ACP70R_002427 [Stipagrostis hirtigluma subsp. patula]
MYAECGHDFIDLLLSFLTYPLGCVTKNLSGASGLGCGFDNLYSSAIDLDAAGFLTGLRYRKETLLDPSLAPLKAQSSGSGRLVREWYDMCWAPDCSCATDKKTASKTCRTCDPEFC